MAENHEQFDRGRFEGQVLARLDSIVGSIAEINVVFLKHSDIDKNEFAILHKRIDSIQKFIWTISGALVILGVIWQFISPRITTLIHLSN